MVIQLAEVKHAQKDGLIEKPELTIRGKYYWFAKGCFTQWQVTGCFYLEHLNSVLIRSVANTSKK